MRKTFLLIMVLLLAVPSFSQQRERQRPVRRKEMNPEAMAMAQTRNLQAVLQLDSLQAQAVFLMNYSDAMAMQDSMRARAERGEGNVKRVPLNEEELRVRREVMKQRRLQRDEQMKGILSPEQYEKYTEYMKKAAENRRPFGRAPRRGAPQAGEQ